MTEEASKPQQRYKATDWREYNAALVQRGSLAIWLDRDMQWFGSPNGKQGRAATFSDAVIQFCLGIKCLFNLPLRQTIGLVGSILSMAGLNWPAPTYSTLSRRQQKLTVHLPYQASQTGLNRTLRGHQVCGRRRMEEEKTRPRIPQAMAQSASGH